MRHGTFGERIHPNSSPEFQRETTAFWGKRQLEDWTVIADASDRLRGDALTWHHARKDSGLQQLRDAAKANAAPGRPASIALTPTEAAAAIWAAERPSGLAAAATSVRNRAVATLREEGQRLRLTDHERTLLKRAGSGAAHKAWTDRTGGDTETWAEAQAHAWRVLRRGKR